MHKKLFLYTFLLAAVVAAGSSLRATDSGVGVITLTNSAPVFQDFDSLSSSTTPSVVLPTGWYLTELPTAAGAGGDGQYAVGSGSSATGGAYSFGLVSNPERALGSVGSGSALSVHYGAKLTNAGSGPITALTISFDGEMWRRGNSVPPNGDRLSFAYSLDAATLGAGTFTPVPALNFASLAASCLNVSGTTAAGATNGNTATCRMPIAATISGLAVNPGTSIWIRWTDTDNAGSDDGLAIDNVSIAATFSSDPTPPNTSASISPNPVSPGQTLTIAGTILPGYNPLSQTYTVTCNLSAVGGAGAQELPNDGASFTYDLAVSLDAPLGLASLPCTIRDDQDRSTDFGLSVKILLPLNTSCNAVATPIAAIQGPGLLSPIAGETVDVEAIVAGDFQGAGGLSGFYLQEPAAEQDTNPATSEGLFIFSSAPVDAGDRIRARGIVAEFASSTGSLTSRLTELSSVSSVQVCSQNEPLPEPVDVTLPVDEPSQWERYEGMQIRLSQQLVVVGNFSLGQFGQIDLAPNVLFQPTHSIGDSASWAAAANLVARSRIALDDGSTLSNTNINGGTVAPYPDPGLSDANTLRVGALVNPNGDAPVPLVGVLDDRFGAYRIHPLTAVTFSNAPNPRTHTAATAAAAGARFTIVSANVLNFFTTLGSRGAFTVTELNNQRTKLVAQLGQSGGDVIGLSELQNFANGSTNGGTYTNAAIADLTSALAVATGRDYRYIDTLDGAHLAPGTAILDNGTDAIRNGLLYDAGAVTPVGGAALYYQNDQNRPSLAQTFQPAAGVLAGEQTFTVVVNHFRSKGSACGPGNDDPFQGNCNGMRTSMANNVATWLAGNPTFDPAGANRRYILIGDFNAYFGEDPIQTLLGPAGYTNLIDALLGESAYSYNFSSQRGYLDHALVNASALPLVKSVVELHINSDEPAALQALDSNLKSAAAQAAYFAPNEFASADHDPIVIGFNPLLGDFSDDGELDSDDRTALLAAAQGTPHAVVDRRMDMNGDGAVTQADFLVWQTHFVEWKKRAR
jgi:predicted extracellular nuclease